MLSSSAQLDGFDIDLTQAPPKQWLPSNVAMHKLDAFSPLPHDLVGKYDIVHLRLFTVLMKHNNPVPLLRNLIGMLKPNGYIQWDEHDHISQKVVTADPAINPKTVQAVLDFVRPIDDMMGPRTWVSALGDIFAAQGLLRTRLYRFALPPELYRYDT
ncbi:hypothetical protein ABVK25_004695 [Lepraria finkii]|uniref:Uncharacterized protein n=1 Tax=Lepraria finkii TaxID=1340010 RepID=A0ABR4BBS2_9LECA